MGCRGQDPARGTLKKEKRQVRDYFLLSSNLPKSVILTFCVEIGAFCKFIHAWSMFEPETVVIFRMLSNAVCTVAS